MSAGVSWLDIKLGFRMLLKHPGLTAVGVFDMAVAIAIGLGSLWTIGAMMNDDLPLDEGDRVVSIQFWDVVANQDERRVLQDFAGWREEGLQTVRDLGAFRTVGLNLVPVDGRGESLQVAEITASGFTVARVPPLLGRYLVPEDERPGAQPTVVIGYDEWRDRFDSDPDVVGRTLQLDRTPHTIVGVMPEGFAFPMNHHFWTPLRLNPSAYERLESPAIYMFARLAPGATMEQARAELAALGQRSAAAFPETHAQLRLRVYPYAYPFGDADNPDSVRLFYLIQLLSSLLLVLVAANVAILVYARTAARMGEISVRSALGASRARIVAQLFVEGLVLSTAAAALGLGITWFGLRQFKTLLAEIGDQLPFWMTFELSPRMVVYAVALAVLGAAIVGVVPALQATGRRLQSALRQLGGGTGIRLGRTWTVLIVAQVAIAVAVLPVALFTAWEMSMSETLGGGATAPELLTARLSLSEESMPPGTPADPAATAAIVADRQAELVRRLVSEPGIADVVLVFPLPGDDLPASVETEPLVPGVAPAREVARYSRVEPNFFDAFGISLLAGRVFHGEDSGGAANEVIVNLSFVQQLLGGGDAVGRRIRYPEAESWVQRDGLKSGEWYEIVGVVSDFPITPHGSGRGDPRLYHPAVPGTLNPVNLVVRTRGATPEQVAGRLREATTALDPTLRLSQVLTAAELDRQVQGARRTTALVAAVAMLTVLLLSAAGIHALMSFTVAQRTREIGIRSALGAHPRQILGSIFARAVRQVGVGVLVGVGVAALLFRVAGGKISGTGAATLLLAAALMTVVGLLAALGPARRGLRIQPSEALRAD